MIDEIHELEEAAGELELLDATLSALSVALHDGKTIIGGNSFVLPCNKLHDISQAISTICEKMFDKLTKNKEEIAV